MADIVVAAQMAGQLYHDLIAVKQTEIVPMSVDSPGYDDWRAPICKPVHRMVFLVSQA